MDQVLAHPSDPDQRLWADNPTVIVESLNNDTTVSWLNQTGGQAQCKVLPTAESGGQLQNAKSSDGFYGAGTNFWILALAVPDYCFGGWTEQTNTAVNPLNLVVNQPYTNLVATFSPLLTTKAATSFRARGRLA